MKIRILSGLTAVLLAGSGCTSLLVDVRPGRISATVRFVNVEGGCWVLSTDAGKRYEPIGLPAAFRQDGLRVSVTIRSRPDAGSFCMVGEIVELTSISAR